MTINMKRAIRSEILSSDRVDEAVGIGASFLLVGQIMSALALSIQALLR